MALNFAIPPLLRRLVIVSFFRLVPDLLFVPSLLVVGKEPLCFPSHRVHELCCDASFREFCFLQPLALFETLLTRMGDDAMGFFGVRARVPEITREVCCPILSRNCPV